MEKADIKPRETHYIGRIVYAMGIGNVFVPDDPEPESMEAKEVLDWDSFRGKHIKITVIIEEVEI